MPENKGSNLVVTIVAVVTLALTAALLLLSAFVIWFAEMINSLTLSLCITGLVLFLTAWLLYKIKLSSILKQLRTEYEMTMTLISLIKSGYDSIVLQVIRFCKSLV